MDVEGIGKCYHHIKNEHVLFCAKIPERKQHEGKDRYAIWRKSYGNISDAALLILYVAIPPGDQELLDTSEEQQCYEGMGKFMGKVHEPVQIMSHLGQNQEEKKDCICRKSA